MINKKEAFMLENDPKYVAENIYNIIKVMIMRMPMENRGKSFLNIKEKLKDFNILELNSKKSPGGASIGVSISLLKNILNGRDSFFIRRVLEELTLLL